MRIALKMSVLAAFGLVGNIAWAVDIKGAGSSAAQPLYTALAAAYAKTEPLGFTYQASGSSDGVKQIRAGSVDFGATDIALSADERKKANVLCFPTAVSGVVPVINLPGVKPGQLQLTGEVLGDIFARKILKWNDARLRELNPGVPLPDMPILVVARADGSGSTYNFSAYLSQANPAWAASFGRNYTIAWSAGITQVKGSSAVASTVKQTPGAIAYVDYQYVTQQKLNAVALRNHDGKFVQAGAAGFSAALANSAWMTGAAYEEMLTNRPGAASWPITSGTFVVVQRVSLNPERTIAVLKLFTWGFVHGNDALANAQFVKLPDTVQGRIFGELNSIVDANSAPLKWSLTDVLKLR